MRPKYIFGAVFAICILMMAVLPQLAGGSHPAAAANVAMAVKAASVSNPTAVSAAKAASVGNIASPTIAPFAAAAQPATAPQPSPTIPVIKPTAAPGNSAPNVPSPADAGAQAGSASPGIPATSGAPDLAAFVSSVTNGQAGLVTGVYVSNTFAMHVVQQPGADINFVSSTDQTVTEYARSAAYGVIGLLAHNTLPAGQEFLLLKPGMDVLVVYGDGRQTHYRIAGVEFYQALSPTDPYSDFIDLNGPGGKLVRNQELFNRIYQNAGKLVFQTCFEANGDPSWGRVFIIANPA